MQLLLAQTTGAISQDAERALAKVAAILPCDLRGWVDELSAIVRFYAVDRLACGSPIGRSVLRVNRAQPTHRASGVRCTAWLVGAEA